MSKSAIHKAMSPIEWLMLIALSVVWGGSFLGIAFMGNVLLLRHILGFASIVACLALVDVRMFKPRIQSSNS